MSDNVARGLAVLSLIVNLATTVGLMAVYGPESKWNHVGKLERFFGWWEESGFGQFLLNWLLGMVVVFGLVWLAWRIFG